MRKASALILILGFLVLDWLRSHDFLKPGEVISAADWLTGLLSLLVFYGALDSLSGSSRTSKAA